MSVRAFKYWNYVNPIDDSYTYVEDYPDEDLYEDGELTDVKAGLKLLRLWSNDEIMIVKKIDENQYDELQNVALDNKRDKL